MALNEKENRFLRHYADVKNPSAGQKQTYQSLQQKINANKTTTPQVVQPNVPKLSAQSANYTTQSPYNEKESRFLRHYSELSAPSADQRKTYMTLQGKINNPTFTNADDERFFRQTNPNHVYTKGVDMRFLNQIDDNLYNNNGVSKAQIDQYNKLAQQWNFDPTKSRVTKDVTTQIENELAMKKKALQDQLSMAQQANELAVQQNNAYLQEQLGQLQNQKITNDDSATKLQNRRGGFYSGGLDYQLGQNASSFNQQSGALSRDIAMRNADIQGRNALLASQAAEQISLLEQQAPDLIRQRITEELARQRDFELQESQVTGTYQGNSTFQKQQWQRENAEWESEQKWNRQFQTDQFAYQKIRDQIEDSKWKTQFDESVRQYGLEYALQQLVTNNQISMDQAQLALSQSQFQFDQTKWNTELELAKQPTSTDLKKYTDQLNKTYLKKNDEGNYSVTNQEGLYRAVIGLNLSDDDTMRLLSMYGLDVSGFLGQ